MTLTSQTFVREALPQMEQRLRAAGRASARVEAEWLLAEALGVERPALYLEPQPLSPEQSAQVEAWLRRRVEGEPLQYIIGFTEFCGHRLAVSPAVLIPRPETEGLVEEALQWMRQRRMRAPAIIEVGTGSGNIAVSLAAALPTCVIVGIELSWTALRLAQMNAQRCGVADRIRWVQADWTCGVSGPFDLVISNPPYVPTDEVRRLQAQTELGYEPWVSLDGGADGMVFHRRLLAEAPRLLSDGGALGMECAESQAEPLAEAAQQAGWARQIRILHDVAGRPRGVWIDTWTP